MTAPSEDWVRQARLDRVIDADTLHLTVDNGMHSYRTESFRLARINAPEKGTVEGAAATLFARLWLENAFIPNNPFDLTIQTFKTDNWGRYVAEVWRRTDGANLSDDLLSSGNAKPWP